MTGKKVLLINADQPEECRAVILQDGKLEDYIVERSGRELVKGNIYLGVITRVEPAIEAAFVDFGGKKFGFLPFKDVLKESYLPTREKKARLRIQDVLVRGQKILVQVVKESRDAKGPSLTNAITIPGRFLVLMCSSDSTGISRKIEDESERKKLKEIISELGLPDNMGAIIRTAGVGRTKLELQKDIQMLLKIWENISEKLKNPDTPAPSLLHEGPDMVVRTVRDHFSNDTNEIIVDNLESFKALKNFIRLVMPRMRNRITHYQDTRPLFSQYRVEEQIDSIYDRRVELPSGGSIVIDVGEAMVSIDVNSGKTTNSSELEETAFRTNMEAATEVCRQLRLRDLGGLIVIDFIDMFQKKNKAAIEKQMKLSCKLDKARVNLSRISRFGLMEMSRQRMSPPVKEGVFDQCSLCSGTGHVKAPGTSALLVIRKIQEIIGSEPVKTLEVTISPAVANYLLNNKMKYLLEFQQKNAFVLHFQTKEGLSVEQFSYSILERKVQERKKETAEREPQAAETRPAETRPMEGPPAPEVPPAASKEGASEDKPESRPRGRRSSSGRRGGAGRNQQRPASPGGRNGSSRRRPRFSSGGRRPPAASAEGQEAVSVKPESGAPSEAPDQDVQPLENVSRLHEVISKPPSFKGGLPRDEWEFDEDATSGYDS